MWLSLKCKIKAFLKEFTTDEKNLGHLIKKLITCSSIFILPKNDYG